MKLVYIVNRNADFTEGRGPMLFDKAFSDGPEAIKYVQGKQGIMGSPQKVEVGMHNRYAYANGYDINEVVVYDTAEEADDANIQKAKDAALAKLTPAERKLLGLA